MTLVHCLMLFWLMATLASVGVAVFQRVSIKKRWLDIPNDRSSHVEPIPRGAGIVIAAACLTLFLLLTRSQAVTYWLPYFFGAVTIAVVGWLDDIFRLQIWLKFIVYVLVAAASVSFFGNWHSVGISTKYSLELGWLGPVVTAIWLVWSINAFNFVDGIDGLAGLQGLIAGIAWSTFFAGSVGGSFFAGVGGACLGFLIFNWSPARVFMGDVGSSFLGYTFAVLPIAFAQRGEALSPVLPVISILFLWPVNFDAGWARLARALRGEKFWLPNREHFYQMLVDTGFSHAFVSGLYGVFALASVAAALIFFNSSNKYGLIPIGLLLLISLAFALTVYRISKTPANVAK